MATYAPADLARSAQLFHALSDETRLAVLDILRDGERCVCDLMAALDAAQSRLSFHLKVLKDAGLVTDRREGRWSYYTIVPAAIDEAHDLLIERLPRTVAPARTYQLRTREDGASPRPRCC
ncbi:MAG: metalloregulator ArsR/SmtB family transcription factor [Gemmatimonadetes bacterium]|nr:metalloregulator ArsR/SmtB family transcription factor [Gemmatimonadota bacterium]